MTAIDRNIPDTHLIKLKFRAWGWCWDVGNRSFACCLLAQSGLECSITIYYSQKSLKAFSASLEARDGGAVSVVWHSTWGPQADLHHRMRLARSIQKASALETTLCQHWVAEVAIG